MNPSKDYRHALWHCVRWSNAMRIGVGSIAFHACDHTPFQWNRDVLSAWTHAKTSATKWQDTIGKQSKADNRAVKQLFAVLVDPNRGPCWFIMIDGYLINLKWHAICQPFQPRQSTDWVDVVNQYAFSLSICISIPKKQLCTVFRRRAIDSWCQKRFW